MAEEMRPVAETLPTTPHGEVPEEGFQQTYGLYRNEEFEENSTPSQGWEQALTWGFSFGVIGGMILVGYHIHFILHLGVGTAFLAMVIYVLQVLFMLCVNLWFMAGQRYVIEFLALYEPTSCIMEWLHDTIFGISEERLATAYTVGGHKGKKTKDGKTYVQLIVPRRRIPYPCSIGGLIHFLFFAAENPFDTEQVVFQMMRSLLVLSIFGLFLQTTVQEWLYHADALYFEATHLQQQGDLNQAAEHYQTIIKQDPLHNPHVAAVHFSHLILRHPWAAGMYLVAANFHVRGQLEQAASAYRQVVEHVGDCALASHALAAVAGTDSSETHRAPAGYVREAFDGYAATYDASMSTLAFRAPEMLNGALEDVMAALAESEERGASAGDAEVRWKKLDKGLDLGCGTGWMGPLVGDKVRWLLGVDLSSRMLDVVGQQRSGVYDALSTADLVDALEKEEAASVGLVVAADALPYFGDLRPVLDRAAAVLQEGGLLAFTLEASEEEGTEERGWALRPSGRFVHGKEYAKEAVRAAGLKVLAVGDGPIRWQGGRPVEGDRKSVV